MRKSRKRLEAKKAFENGASYSTVLSKLSKQDQAMILKKMFPKGFFKKAKEK